MKRNTESAVRGLKPSIWNEKERTEKEKSRTGSESGRKEQVIQRKCLFDSVAAKLLTAGKRLPERQKEHQRSFKQLLLQRQEKAKSQTGKTSCHSGTRFACYIWNPSSSFILMIGTHSCWLFASSNVVVPSYTVP